MSAAYCNVALPVPLRTTFTYGVPEALCAQLQPGSRVLVPFRKKSLVGVVLELAARRELVLTEAGRALAEKLQQGATLTDLGDDEAAFLQRLLEKKGTWQVGPAAKLGISPGGLQRLQRRGYLQIQETLQGRKRKMQRVVAWKGTGGQRGTKPLDEKEERLRALLQTERGPLP